MEGNRSVFLSLMNLLSWIPESALGQWLWAVGAVATLNGLQNLAHPAFSRRVYASKEGEKEATALAARLFGVWNLTSAMVRLYAAYHLHDRGAYLLCLGTFLIAQVHFFAEMLFFGTLALGPGSISPLVVSCMSCYSHSVLGRCHDRAVSSLYRVAMSRAAQSVG